MRKLYFLILLTVICSFSSRSQYVTIPDPNFKNSLMQQFPTCFNASGQMDTTCSNILDLYIMNVMVPVSNWDGLQYFDNITELTLVYDMSTFPDIPHIPALLTKLSLLNLSATTFPPFPNWIKTLSIDICNITTIPALPGSLTGFICQNMATITTLPALPASLLSLSCPSNAIVTLPALPAGLVSLNCSQNPQLTSLPSLPTSLSSLGCGHCSITSLGATLPASLFSLDFGNNNVSVLPALPAGLYTLNANNNQLTTLPAFPNSLVSIDVGHNNITSIPALPPTLGGLVVSNNSISTLPSLPNTIVNLFCESNLISSISSLPSALEVLVCDNNQLSSLPPFSATLNHLSCSSNQLTSLPSLPNILNYLNCSFNQLTSIPGSALPAGLQILYCDNNRLTFLPEFPQGLWSVTCAINYIRCLPVLPHGNLQLSMDNRIGCIPNAPSSYDIYVYDTASATSQYYTNTSGQAFPLCSITNNIYHCSAFPVMAGHVYNDNNSNGVKDANEPYRANVRVTLSNGHFTTTDNNGVYTIGADSIGAYTLTCSPPNYFAAVPPSYNYNFSTYDTISIKDFALQATSTVDSLFISVTPQRWAARIGMPMPYDISYENGGTTTLTPTIFFNYPNSQLIYDSSSNAGVVNNGTYLRLNETAMVAGDRRNFTAYFHVDTNATLGDSVHVDAVITANAVTATDTAISQIRGPYDPNDKFATPLLTPEQVTAGKYINYTIRFQNTGNDTAFNVVITDTLSSFLQGSTLQMTNASHPCKTTVIGNTVSFEFLNIMLPDSNVNELKSHGYVSFKIKPQSNVTLNTNIPNAANIYFDYNLPVLTNTAITQIANPGTVPLKLLSFTVDAKAKNTANVYWSTFNEYNLQDFVIEYSIDGSNYSATASELPKGKQYNSYIKEVPVPAARVVYYRLKITDTDGRFYYGPVATLKMNIEPSGIVFLSNPVKDVLRISIKDASLMNTTARIMNAQGLVVQKIYLKNETQTVNVSNLSAGTYIFETVNGSNTFVVIK